jgi:hypothetical protein
MYGWQKSTAALAAQAPWWEPEPHRAIAHTTNKMGPGILGSDRMATYRTLIFDALGSG